MQKRIRLQKMLIAALAVIIALLLVGLVAGRNNTIPVLIVGSEAIDLTKPLSEQTELLSVEEMSQEEYDRFGGNLVTSIEQIKGARLKFPLKVRSPILLSALTTTDAAGQFAANTPQYHTIFKMPEITGSLPPGIQAGDKVDIDLLIEKEGTPPTFVIGPLLQGVKVSGVEETTLYLMVSQREYEMLSVARRVGSFIVQLPGQKKVDECQTIHSNILEEKEKALIDLSADKVFNKLDEEEQQKALNELEEKYEHRLANAECFDEKHKPSTLTSDLIIKQVEEGKSFEEIMNENFGYPTNDIEDIKNDSTETKTESKTEKEDDNSKSKEDPKDEETDKKQNTEKTNSEDDYNFY